MIDVVHPGGAARLRGRHRRRRLRQRARSRSSSRSGARTARRSSTSPARRRQAEGPINLFMGESMFKMVTGIVLIMALDPADPLQPRATTTCSTCASRQGSIVQPDFPAPAVQPLAHARADLRRATGRARTAEPRARDGRRLRLEPALPLLGRRRATASSSSSTRSTTAASRAVRSGDGMDVHAWWPHVTSIPAEYAESYFPVRIERVASRMDSGGAGEHRGGNGVEKVYGFLEPGEVSIHDDRHVSQPWGIGGGRPPSARARCSSARTARGRSCRRSSTSSR